MTHIYIALVDTPGFFAYLIRNFLKQRYVHVVISADAKLKEAYSVGRRDPAVPVFAGFEKEDKYEILDVFPNAYYRVCELECTYEQKKNIMEKLESDYRMRFRIHYAVLALPFLLLGLPFYVRNQYTCSSYIARLLKENGICVSDKHFSLITPKDFYEYEGMRTVFEGELSQLAEDEMHFAWGVYDKGATVYE